VHARSDDDVTNSDKDVSPALPHLGSPAVPSHRHSALRRARRLTRSEAGDQCYTG
jgi:hypothetical protein